jgi:ABC-type sugar transport system ATPase subunit
MASASPLLSLDGIEACYGLSQVLFGLSLSIAPGEMVTLMGRNGMGKTTTVRSIMGSGWRIPKSAGCRPTALPSSVSASCRKAARFSRT